MLAAVIFDFDGIIVDTEPFHHKAFMEVLKPYGIACSWADYLEHYAGFDDRDAFRAFFSNAGKRLSKTKLLHLLAEKAETFAAVVAGGVTPYPGVLGLIRTLAHDLPLGLCSGAVRSDILPILSQIGLDNIFRVIVTADDVPVSKPDPACYRLALQQLSCVAPDLCSQGKGCLAIEDTPTGIAAARGAGLPVLAITNNYPAERLQGEGCTVRSSLVGIGVAELQAILRGK